VSLLLYLHGFLSSPQSEKAQQTIDYAAEHYPQLTVLAPQIPNTPDAAISMLERWVLQKQSEHTQPLRLIGSSMGGFMATWLLERFGGKAVLINPAVDPDKLFKDYLGEHTNPYTGEVFHLVPEHIAIIAQHKPPIAKPECYKVLLQQGDETLDYALAVHRYAGGDISVEQGGDHSFQGYEQHLPDIFAFLLDSEKFD
jgi:predicted esterase YcpF (UPF0227 family)